MKIPLICATAALALILAKPAACAVTSSIGSVAGVAFGIYDVFRGTALDSAGAVTFRCDNVSAQDTVLIQLSRGSSASFQPRTLQHGMDQLQYNLYLDPSRSTIWGDGSSGTSQYGPISPPDASSVLLNISGRVPSPQNVRAGSYSDPLVVTIVF